jgi:hypothetical protein
MHDYLPIGTIPNHVHRYTLVYGWSNKSGFIVGSRGKPTWIDCAEWVKIVGGMGSLRQRRKLVVKRPPKHDEFPDYLLIHK